jgi:hypothetical protein
MAAARGPERVYSRVATYSIGDIVCHEQFGTGVVLTLASHKCTVLFKDQARLMATANEGRAAAGHHGGSNAFRRAWESAAGMGGTGGKA